MSTNNFKYSSNIKDRAPPDNYSYSSLNYDNKTSKDNNNNRIMNSFEIKNDIIESYHDISRKYEKSESKSPHRSKHQKRKHSPNRSSSNEKDLSRNSKYNPNEFSKNKPRSRSRSKDKKHKNGNNHLNKVKLLYSYEPQRNTSREKSNDKSPRSSKKSNYSNKGNKSYNFDNFEPQSTYNNQDNYKDRSNKDQRDENKKIDFFNYDQNPPKPNLLAGKITPTFDTSDIPRSLIPKNYIFNVAKELERCPSELTEKIIEENNQSLPMDGKIDIEAPLQDKDLVKKLNAEDLHLLTLQKSKSTEPPFRKNIDNFLPELKQVKSSIEPPSYLRINRFPTTQSCFSDKTATSLVDVNDKDYVKKLLTGNLLNHPTKSIEKELLQAPEILQKNISESIEIEENKPKNNSSAKKINIDDQELKSLSPVKNKSSDVSKAIQNIKKNNEILLVRDHTIKDPRFSLLYKVLKDQKKNSMLNLILDIDETVVNSITNNKSSQTQTLKVYIDKNREIFSDYYYNFCIDFNEVYCIIRPGVYDFLRNISKYYNIYVYSHGTTNYIEELVKKIDPLKKYIRRDKMFTNRGDGSMTNKIKELNKLEFNEEEIKKTIILDDLRMVWEESQHDRVIISKKFIPFKDFMEKSKIQSFHLSTVQRLPYEDIDLYEDIKIDENESQLSHINTFLEDLAKRYNSYKLILPEEDKRLDMKFICKGTMGIILKDCRMKILTLRPERKKFFSEIANVLGASIENTLNITHVIVDKKEHINEDLIKEIKKLINIPEIIIIDVKWLMESYFSLKRRPTKDYITRLE